MYMKMRCFFDLELLGRKKKLNMLYMLFCTIAVRSAVNVFLL